MIDEVYAVNAALPKSHQSAARILAMQVACEIYWVGGGLVGVLIASLLPGPIKGLEFALCTLFTVLALDAFRSRRQIPSVMLAGASIGIALDSPSMVSVDNLLGDADVAMYQAKAQGKGRYQVFKETDPTARGARDQTWVERGPTVRRHEPLRLGEPRLEPGAG